jgi:hypothetical protein
MTFEALRSFLWTPLGGERIAELGMLTAWHGRLMVLAWGFAVPLAILMARYYKVMPGQQWPVQLDNKTWWHGHRLLNYLAVVISFVALALVFGDVQTSGPMRNVHALMGWTLLALAMLQIMGAHLRGSKGGPSAPRLDALGQVLDLHGDHYDMTLRRRCFEHLHKTVGLLAWLLAWATVVVGLQLAHAPYWMLLSLLFWYCALLTVAVKLQRAGRCLDTYQAIWGADPSLPGNQRKPIGWGVRRVSIEDNNPATGIK